MTPTTTTPKKTPFKIKETTTREYSGGEIPDVNADKVIQAAYGAKMPQHSPGSMLYGMSSDPDLPATRTPQSFSYKKGGKTMSYYQDGGPLPGGEGVAQGPDHEQGGIDVVAEGGGAEPVAEIEGGERVFSQEDTAMLEEAAMSIAEAMDSGDRAQAEDMAMQLGFAVVNMIAAQEQNQAGQQGGGGAPAEQVGIPPEEDPAMAAANQFSQEPEAMETI